MNQLSHLFSQATLSRSGLGIGLLLSLKLTNLFPAQKGIHLKVINHTQVVNVKPELIKLIDRCLSRIKPDRPAL